MRELLSAIFDDRERGVVIVSSYDMSISYCNRAALTVYGLDLDDVMGENILAAYRRLHIDPTDLPVIRCLHDPEHKEVVGKSPEHGDVWWAASVVPSADDASPEVLATCHEEHLSTERALAEHRVLRERAALAIEHARTRRLLAAASAAVNEAARRLDWMSLLLLRAGQLPINPSDGVETPL